MCVTFYTVDDLRPRTLYRLEYPAVSDAEGRHLPLPDTSR